MEAERKGKKALSLCILRVLERYASPDAPMTSRQIIDRVEADYGLTAERKAVGRNLLLLAEMGFELSTYQDNGHGYYLHAPQAWDAQEERQVLYDALLRAPASLLRSAMLEQLESDLPAVVRVGEEAPDSEQSATVYLLREAIRDTMKVTFSYRPDTAVLTVSPGCVAFDGSYALLAVPDGTEEAAVYRLSRMTAIRALDERATLPKRMPDPLSLLKRRSEPEVLELLCQPGVLDDLYARFPDATLRREGGYLRARVHAPWEDVGAFLAEHMTHAILLSPEERRTTVREALQQALSCYPQ